MPIYSYKCCVTELKQFSGKAIPRCPQCGLEMPRQFGTPTAIAMETVDQYKGKSRFSDMETKRLDRATEFSKKTGQTRKKS